MYNTDTQTRYQATKRNIHIHLFEGLSLLGHLYAAETWAMLY